MRWAQRLLRDPVLWRFAGLGGLHLGSMGCGFAAVVLTAEHYGALGLGEISLAGSLVTYGLVVANLGTDLYAVRRVSAKPTSLARMVPSVVRVRAAAATVAFAVLALIAWTVPAFRPSAILIVTFGLSIPLASLHLLWVPQALHRPMVFGAAQCLTQVFYLGFLGIAIVMDGELLAVAAARVAADLLVVAGLWRWRRRVAPMRALALPARGLKALARAASPIAGSQFVRSLALGSDLVLVALLVSREALGHYSAAYRLFMVLLSLGTTYFVILLPRIAERARQRDAMAAELRGSLWRLVPLTALGVIVLAAVAAPLLERLFGPSFVAAAPALRLLGFAFLANVIGRHYRQVLLARGRQGADLRWTALSAIVHVASKWILGRLWGITGAACGTLLGELFLLGGLGLAARAELRPSTPAEARP